MNTVGFVIDIVWFEDEFWVIFADSVAVAIVVSILLLEIIAQDIHNNAIEIGVRLSEPINVARIRFDDGPNRAPTIFDNGFIWFDGNAVLSHDGFDVFFTIFYWGSH